jgi:quinol monooxygenase YgiN
MYLVNVKVRARAPEDADHICRIFRHTLQLTQEPGYARGLCSVDVEDNCSVLIEEEWGSMAALRAWLNSASCQQLLQQITPLIEGPVEMSIYEEKV